MVPSSVVQRERNPGYVGDVGRPVTALAFGRSFSCGSQSVISSASSVSGNIPVVNQPIPVVSNSSTELVSILKSVHSNSEIVRSNTASPVEVVSDISGCLGKIENKCGKYRSSHKCSNKDVSALFLLMKE